MSISIPPVFLGDRKQYHDRKATFLSFVDKWNVPLNERIFYLKQYVGGCAEISIVGSIMLGSVFAYNHAFEVLDARFATRKLSVEESCNLSTAKSSRSVKRKRRKAKGQIDISRYAVQPINRTNKPTAEKPLYCAKEHNSLVSTNGCFPCGTEASDSIKRFPLRGEKIDVKLAASLRKDFLSSNVTVFVTCYQITINCFWWFRAPQGCLMPSIVEPVNMNGLPQTITSSDTNLVSSDVQPKAKSTQCSFVQMLLPFPSRQFCNQLYHIIGFVHLYVKAWYLSLRLQDIYLSKPPRAIRVGVG
jgi:hypothetical protein